MKNAGGQGDKGKEFNPMRSIAVARRSGHDPSFLYRPRYLGRT
ncbi:MAG: hypothetical protein ACLUIQ_10525 [Dialister invisus]